jgi:hypothetical protein
MWYRYEMFLFGHSIRFSRLRVRRLTMLLAVSFLCCTILQGNTYCFCSADCGPDCEEDGDHHAHGHAGSDPSFLADDGCDHLSLGDLQPSERSRVGDEKIVRTLSADLHFLSSPHRLLVGPLLVTQVLACQSRGSPPYPLIFIAQSHQLLC